MLECTPIGLSVSAVSRSLGALCAADDTHSRTPSSFNFWAVSRIAAWDAELSAETYLEACAGPNLSQ